MARPKKVNTTVAASHEKAPRKAYPSREERVQMADKQISKLTKLNDSRQALVDRTSTILEQRKEALAKSEQMLEKAIARKEKLLNPSAIKVAKSETKTKMNELLVVLKQNGKSIDDILTSLKNDF